VDAPAGTLFEVIIDYAGYPRFNPAVAKIMVVAKDENGAEFIAIRKTRIAKQVRAFDRYERTETSSSSGPTVPNQRLDRRGPSTLSIPAARPSPSTPRPPCRLCQASW
jgi:hypothetical protein